MSSVKVGASAGLLALCVLYLCGQVQAAGWADEYGDKVNFTLFLPHRNATVGINDSALLVQDPGFVSSRMTVLYMHGYTESNQSESVGLIANAFLKRGDHNFILVDWNSYSSSPYVWAFFNVFQVSHAVARAVNRMVKAGLRKDKLWIVAHSLGGQLAGLTAKDLDFKLPRITALDPALPGFTFNEIPHLDGDDAELVDVIHTDSGFFGFKSSLGLDFWPHNGSRLQPGCPSYVVGLYDGHCSHHRSWRLFAESLLNETAFPAVPCESWETFESNQCGAKLDKVVYMGIKAKEARVKKGNYFLETNGEEPFGRGADGLDVKSSRPWTFVTKLIGKLKGGLPLPTDWGWN